MFSLKMITFCKDASCPSSQELLTFQRSEDSFKNLGKIKIHLSECEFCAAEIEFYAHYPPVEETIAKVKIPLPLYELAEALLNHKHKDFSALNKLLCESENLKV